MNAQVGSDSKALVAAEAPTSNFHTALKLKISHIRITKHFQNGKHDWTNPEFPNLTGARVHLFVPKQQFG